MATGNMLLGYARRKLGDVVFYRADGQQRARARNRNPRNPRSAKQAVQRMVLATGSKMTSALMSIVDHSWEGTEVGTPSVRLFQSRALTALRKAAAHVINQVEGTIPSAAFAIKGAPIAGCLEHLYVSQGRLSMNAYRHAGNTLQIQLASALNTITSEDVYRTELAKFGIVPGDQLTFLCYSNNYNIVVASYNDEVNIADMWRFCRVVFKADVSDLDFSSGIPLFQDGAINSVFLAESYGALPSFSEGTDTSAGYLVADFEALQETGYTLAAGAVIRSQRQESGKYYYSSAHIACDHDALDNNNAAETYPSYMADATEINVGDQLYLRHAEAAPFGQGE